jgi:CelD/BcsL family acetyltransferase involved in cellulose biosynthesis
MTWTLLPVAEFAAYAERWAQFNAETCASPLLQPEFVQPLITEFSTGKELLALCGSGGTITAMAIMAPRGPGKWDTFQPSQAPIGMWMHRPGTDVAAALAALARSLPGFPLALGLTQRDPALEPRPDDGASIKTVDYIQTARIRIEGSFDEYWSARGKNLRTNLKKQRAKLLKDGITTRLEVLRAPQDVATAIADYGRLESTGWKAGIGTAVSADNTQGRFYQSMLENFCARGAGSILRYWFDDRVVAMNLCIEGYGCVVVLKTAYDESIGSQFSPAFLMREETCQQLFDEQKFATLEFYGRVMEWHLRWTDDIRTMYHLTSYRWPALRQIHTLINNRAALLARLSPQLPAALPVEQGKPSE